MAAGDVYINPGAKVVFGSEGGDTVNWSTENIANEAGRQSAQHDLGAGPRPHIYLVRFYTQCQATPSVEKQIKVYLKTSDHATLHLDNDDGTGDIAVSDKAKLKNLLFVGDCEVDEAAANVEFVLSRVVMIASRYVHAVLWNESGAAITNDAAETKLELTPIPEQVQ